MDLEDANRNVVTALRELLLEYETANQRVRDALANNPAIAFMGGREAQDRAVKGMVPLGRQGVPSEIAPMFVYLASNESSYMTAQAITIDGGVYN